MWKHSQDCVGKVFSFKVVENRSDYLVLKTVLEKKAKFAVMPKPLSTNFGISLPIDGPEFTFDGYVFELFSALHAMQSPDLRNFVAYANLNEQAVPLN